MMKTNSHSIEKTFELSIKKYLTDRGWEVIKVGSHKKGWPDLTCFRSGVTFFIETKKGNGGRIGFYQAKTVKRLRSLGFRAEFIEDWQQFLDYYEEIIGDWNGIIQVSKGRHI